MAILGRMVREGRPQGGHLSKGQEEVRKHTVGTSGGKYSRQRGRQCNGPEAERCRACLWSRKKLCGLSRLSEGRGEDMKTGVKRAAHTEPVSQRGRRLLL